MLILYSSYGIKLRRGGVGGVINNNGGGNDGF